LHEADVLRTAAKIGLVATGDVVTALVAVAAVALVWFQPFRPR